MRYIVTIFWGLILGQVAGFLIGALSGASYDPATAGVVSIVFVLVLFTLPAIMKHFTPVPVKNEHK